MDKTIVTCVLTFSGMATDRRDGQSVAYAPRIFTLTSPDQRVTARINVVGPITYEVSVDGKPRIQPSVIDFKISLGLTRKSVSAKTGPHRGVLHPVVWQKTKTIPDEYNELRLDWRAYNNGVIKPAAK